MKKGVIIAGFAGIGKTFCGARYRNCIDLESSPYKYIYDRGSRIQIEKMKGAPNRILNPDYPQNYINAIKEAVSKYDVVFVQLQPLDINLEYDKNHLDYICIFPNLNTKTKLRNIYLDRGNNDAFADKCIEALNKFYDICNERDYNVIELEEGEFIEDYLKNSNLNIPLLPLDTENYNFEPKQY